MTCQFILWRIGSCLQIDKYKLSTGSDCNVWNRCTHKFNRNDLFGNFSFTSVNHFNFKLNYTYKTNKKVITIVDWPSLSEITFLYKILAYRLVVLANILLLIYYFVNVIFFINSYYVHKTRLYYICKINKHSSLRCIGWAVCQTWM